MKVKELIKALSKMDQELDVTMDYSDHCTVVGIVLLSNGKYEDPKDFSQKEGLHIVLL